MFCTPSASPFTDVGSNEIHVLSIQTEASLGGVGLDVAVLSTERAGRSERASVVLRAGRADRAGKLARDGELERAGKVTLVVFAASGLESTIEPDKHIWCRASKLRHAAESAGNDASRPVSWIPFEAAMQSQDSPVAFLVPENLFKKDSQSLHEWGDTVAVHVALVSVDAA